MIPPSGFKSELYPLRHRLIHSAGLSLKTGTMNSVFFTMIRHTNDIIAGTPQSIVVNPHNALYVEDAGPAVCKMSIIDKLSMSLKFNMTENCLPGSEVTSGAFQGNGVGAVKILWRPIFFSFGEKLDAADDDTTTTVEAILALTKDDTLEDIVPLTTTKLPTAGASDLSVPVSTVNIAEVFGDYNMTTNTTAEEHVWDEDLFNTAMRRYSNRGALKSMVGRTRHLTLTTARPFKNYFIDKFVPKSIRRVMPFTFMGIQIHMPLNVDIEQAYTAVALTSNVAHVGVKMLTNFHEWNQDHWQGMSGAAPAP